MKKMLMVIAVMALFAAGTAQADLAIPSINGIATWDMSQMNASNQTSASGGGSSHVTAFSMVRGAGLTQPASTNNALNSSGWTGETTDYVQFGFRVDSGYHVNLSDLYFGTKVSATGPTQLLVKTSLDNYASTIYTVAQDNSGGTYKNPDLKLNTLGPVTGDFYVRFYGTGATSGGGTMRISAYAPSGTYYYDTIAGTVAPNVATTPIPAAVWLFGSGLAGLVGLRRRMA